MDTSSPSRSKSRPDRRSSRRHVRRRGRPTAGRWGRGRGVGVVDDDERARSSSIQHHASSCSERRLSGQPSPSHSAHSPRRTRAPTATSRRWKARSSSSIGFGRSAGEEHRDVRPASLRTGPRATASRPGSGGDDHRGGPFRVRPRARRGARLVVVLEEAHEALAGSSSSAPQVAADRRRHRRATSRS